MYAVHRTVLAVDVEGFGDPARTGVHQAAVRGGLYRALKAAFSSSVIPWQDCHVEDRGDGVFVLAPPDVAKQVFSESLPTHLDGEIREHNAVHGEEARIRLRIALHAGEVYLDDHGATGSSINLAFRLLEAGELKSALRGTRGRLAMIVSSWFFDEVVRNSPAGDPSAYRRVQVSVKETTATAWIVLPGRPAERDSPRARAGPPIPRQLPARRPLTGRIAELRRLGSLLSAEDDDPVCVISGTAGVGKTALALCWAHREADRYTDGQLYADLNGFGRRAPAEPEEILHRFLLALGVGPPAIPSGLSAKAALYRSLLAGRHTLVLLDNARNAEQVRSLLPGAPGAAVIITSRDRLTGLTAHIDARHLQLGILDAAGSCEVLAARLGGDRVAAEPAAAAALAERCAGLPIALTIAAARAASRPALPLHRLVDELADERTWLDALSLDDPDLNLRSVFSWSYRHLPSAPARLFRLLSLHPGPDADVHAASALARTDPAVTRRSIEALLGAHLLDESRPGRFRAHDLLRAYARDLAEEKGEATTAANGPLARLFSHYLATADRADRLVSPHRLRLPLDFGEEAPAAPDFDGDDAALEWLAMEHPAMASLCRIAGEGLEPRRWQLAYTLRGFFYLTKRWDAWIRTHDLALAACVKSGDRHAEAVTRNNLGRALLESGRGDEAAVQYEWARRLFEELGDQHGLHNAMANQASILRRQGRFDAALQVNRRVLAFYRRVGARRNTAITLRSIALVELKLGALADAERHAEEALDVFAGLSLHLDAAKGLNSLGLVRQRRGDLTRAEAAYRQAIESSRRCGSRYEEARALHRLGTIAVAQGSDDTARERWGRALGIYRDLGAGDKAARLIADLSALNGALSR